MSFQFLAEAEGSGVPHLDLFGFDSLNYDRMFLFLDGIMNSSFNEGPQPMIQFSNDGTTINETPGQYQTQVLVFASGPVDPNVPYKKGYVGGVHKGAITVMDFTTDPNWGGTYGAAADFVISSAGSVGGVGQHTTFRGPMQIHQGPAAHFIEGVYAGNQGNGVKGIRIKYTPYGTPEVNDTITGRAVLYGLTRGGGGAMWSEYAQQTIDMSVAGAAYPIALANGQPQSVRFNCFYNGMSAEGFCDAAGNGACSYQVSTTSATKLRTTTYKVMGASSPNDWTGGFVTLTPAGLTIDTTGQKVGNPTGNLLIDIMAQG